MSVLLELAAHVAALPGERIDRELLIDIFRACRPRSSFDTGKRSDAARGWFIDHWDEGACLSAAMTLVPDRCGFYLNRYWLSRPAPGWSCELAFGGVPSDPRRVYDSYDAFQASLAVTAACLRARAADAAEGQ